MCTLVYSVNSHRKIVHLPHCKIIHRIPKASRRTFSSLEEAQAHGYHLCSCCPSIAGKYRKERRQVNDFYKDKGFTFKLLDGTIHVISRHDCWRIIVNGSKKSLILYHKNTDKRYHKEPDSGIMPGFHSQSFRSRTILGYLKYIASHDSYRDEHPCTEKASPVMDKVCELPQWVIDKYGEEYASLTAPKYRRVKGTKKYRKEQAKKKRQERRASIIRVNALLEELAVIGY